MPRKYATVADRIIANSIIDTENAYAGTYCWCWIGKVTKNNRGQFYPVMTARVDGKVRNVRAHRVVLAEIKGKRMTAKSVALHLCNNSLCVNPEHLARGTQTANVRQCVREGRHYTPFAKAA